MVNGEVKMELEGLYVIESKRKCRFNFGLFSRIRMFLVGY